MATKESMAIRANAACSRIEAQLAEAGVSLALPRLHRDREMLRCIQLEAIADALESLAIGESPVLQEARALIQTRYTKAELEAVLHGIDSHTD